MCKLSILIPTLEQRHYQLGFLINEINLQRYANEAFDKVELLFDSDSLTDPNRKTTGKKRNDLLQKAKGEYCWFVDDDDMIMANAIREILKGIEYNLDSFAINGIMTTDGADLKKWYIAKDNPYIADWSTGEEIYLRYPNHITPMKTDIARQIGFPDQSNFEDKEFADKLKASGLIKTEYKIETPVYHYQYSTTNKTY